MCENLNLEQDWVDNRASYQVYASPAVLQLVLGRQPTQHSVTEN